MSSFIRPRRGRHVDLPTHQRRARHLRNLTVRNLSGKGMDGPLSSFFTLHDTRKNTPELYRSEIVSSSLNPSWKAFNLSLRGDILPSYTSIVVRIWINNQDHLGRRKSMPVESFRLAIEWTVDLMALVYVGEHLFRCRLPNESNLLVFGMFEGYYVAPADEKLSQKALAATLNVPSLTVDKEDVKESYSSSRVSHLNAVHRRVATKKQTVRNALDSINLRYRDVGERRNLTLQCETNRSRVNMLAEKLQRQQQCLMFEEQVVIDTRDRLAERGTELSRKVEELSQAEQDLKESRRHLENRREVLYRTGTALQACRCIMLRELSLVFPIVEQARNGYCILGVNVPNSESLSSESSDAIGVGFGYAAHLVFLLALILHLPLRYPIVPRGSRSIVRDNINEMSSLAATKGECNLFPKQRPDKDTVFQYALFLLNKNISQMRYYCDLGTADGRETLRNIKTLLDRFAVIGDRLCSKSVAPLLIAPGASDEDTVDGLPRPTRSFSVIPSFKGPSGSPVNLTTMTWPLLGSSSSTTSASVVSPGADSVDGGRAAASPPSLSLGHRRQHSAPLTPLSTLVSADEDASYCLSADSSPTVEPKHGRLGHQLAPAAPSG